jgi:P-type Cu+ transporter
MKTIKLMISNMHCEGCVRLVESELKEIPGVISAKANLSDQSVTINYDGDESMLQQFRKILNEAGYPEV